MNDTENPTGGETTNINSSNDDKPTSKTWIYIIVGIIVTIILGVVIGVSIHFATRDPDAGEYTETQTVQTTTTVNVTTNGTFVNQTITILTNGTYVNQTISVFTNGTCVNDTSIVDNNGTIVNTTVTICTNGTYVNTTQLVFVNGSYVNVSGSVYEEGETITVTFIETEVIELSYIWYDNNAMWQSALQGADVVEYFSLSASATATVGSNSYTSTVYGIDWRFKDQTNKDLFDANPENYVPAYGAHCAKAMAAGTITSGDPDAWTVYNGVLYINKNTNVRTSWSSDKDGNIANADVEWATMAYDNPH